jgi:hypothetical protein
MRKQETAERDVGDNLYANRGRLPPGLIKQSGTFPLLSKLDRFIALHGLGDGFLDR